MSVSGSVNTEWVEGAYCAVLSALLAFSSGRRSLGVEEHVVSATLAAISVEIRETGSNIARRANDLLNN